MITGSTFDHGPQASDHMMIGLTTRDVEHVQAALFIVLTFMDAGESDPHEHAEVKALLEGFTALDKAASMSPEQRKQVTSRG